MIGGFDEEDILCVNNTNSITDILTLCKMLKYQLYFIIVSAVHYKLY